MLSFSDIRNLQLGGPADASAIVAAMLGGGLTSPLALGLGPAGILLGAGLAAAGGGWIGKRLAGAVRLDVLEEGSKLAINSSPPPPYDPDGVHLGFIAESGEPLIIPRDSWLRHSMIIGNTGVGKTVLGEWLMFQQILRGGGITWVDGKLDAGNLEKLWAMCAWAGREDDLLVVNPGNPEVSNTYNPLLDGDADEIAARCVSLIPTAETNAGADYYRQSSTIAITTLVESIQSLGKAYDFSDLRLLLTNDRALTWLLDRVGVDTDTGRELNLFLEQFRSGGRPGAPAGAIALDRLRQVFGGLGSRLTQFGQGKFGHVMNTYLPEVRLKDCILGNKILYVMLPTMGKSEAASALGKMVIGDLRSAVAMVQAMPTHLRPNPAYLSFFDEAGSYVTQAWSRMFEQARSARLVMVPAFQTKANLEVIGEELRAMVSGNTTTKMFFQPGEPDTAQWMADMIGEEQQTEYSVSASAATSHKDTAITERLSRGSVDTDTKNNNVGYSERLVSGYKIEPSDLMKLGQGECIVTWKGHNVYHVRVPRLTFSKAFLDEIGPFRIAHARPRPNNGLNLIEEIAPRRHGNGDRVDDDYDTVN